MVFRISKGNVITIIEDLNVKLEKKVIFCFFIF